MQADLESLAEDENTRRILLRMAALSRSGRTESFLREIRLDRDLDEATKAEVAELANNGPFLRAVEDYFGRSTPFR